MKTCAYCGKENEDDAVYCRECKTEEFKGSASVDTPAEPAFLPVKLEFTTPTPQEMEQDFVTLVTCGTLLEADMLVAQLESAGIDAFIPDQFLMQNIAFNLNTYGYVRLQVSPKDFEAAKELLLAGQGG